MVPNNDKDRTYAVSYVPKVAGLHKVSPRKPPDLLGIHCCPLGLHPTATAHLSPSFCLYSLRTSVPQTNL